MELLDYLRLVKKYVWISLLGAIVVGAAGLGANVYTNFIPIYSTVSTVLVGGDVATVNSDTEYIQLADQFTNTYADLATRDLVLQKVIDVLGLDTTPGSLSGYVSTEVLESTQLIEITATDNDPVTAAAIANEVARQLQAYTPQGVRNFVLMVEEAKRPVFPSFTFLLVPIVAGVLGFLLVAGVALLAEFLYGPVYSADEISRRLGLPVLATIRARPATGGRKRRAYERHLPRWRRVNDAPWWPLVQACYQRIEELGANTPLKTQYVMVTSAMPTDRRAKALVAANLATAWARNGTRVVLVEGDLDSPLLAKMLKAPEQPGLADLLKEPATEDQLQAALHPTSVAGLSLLPLGNLSENTFEALSAQSFKQLLDGLSKYADAIVVNGPPVLTGGEGAVMAGQVQGVLLTLKAGRTRMESVADAQTALTMARSNLWGAILLDGVSA